MIVGGASRLKVGRRRARGWIGLASVIGLAVAVLFLSRAGRALVIDRPLPTPPAAILVLASHEWERIPAADAIARRHPSSRVLLTEPVRPTQVNCHLCATRPDWLRAIGVDRARVTVLPRRVVNTYDEAVAAREYVVRERLGSLLVVTSPYHTRRALAVFETVWADMPVPVGVHPAVATSPAAPATWWAASYDRAYVPYEWAALVWYAVRHGVTS